MIAVYPDEALLEIQDLMLSEDLILHLFINNVTPSFATILANLTDATFIGYSPRTLAPADWISKGIYGHHGYALATPIPFVNGEAVPTSCYGYFLTNALGTKLRQAVRFDSAPVTKLAGGTFLIFPTWGDFSESG